MSSAAFSPSNAYQAPPAPAPAKLDRESWNAVMGSIAERLGALEAKRTELQDLINDLSFNGQARLDEAIVPLITQTQAQIDELQRRVAETIAANGAIIETFQEDIAEALASLNAQIAAVEARVDTILQGGLPAADVAETADRVFVTPAQREKIGEVDGKAPTVSPVFTGDPRASNPGRTDNDDSIATTSYVRDLLANLSSVPGSTLRAPTRVAGTNTQDVATTEFVQAAIANISHVATEIFTQSGTFTKHADDVFYFVTIINGGQGGRSGRSSATASLQAGGPGGVAGRARELILFPSDIAASTAAVIVGSGSLGAEGAAGNSGPAAEFGGESSFAGFSAAATGDLALLQASGYGVIGAQSQPTASSNSATPADGYAYKFAGNGGNGVGAFNSAPPPGVGGRAGQSQGGATGAPQPGDGGPGAPYGGGVPTIGGSPGVAPGGGGGGGAGATGAVPGSRGGDGARGEVRVKRFKRRVAA